MLDHPNVLLSKLDRDLFDRLMLRAHTVELEQRTVIAETHSPVSAVYFPHSGVISNVVELVGGGAIETAMIGRDGAFGAAMALDDKVSVNLAIIQVAGTFTKIDSSDILTLAIEVPSFRKLLVAYEQFNSAQMQQTAACNALHRVETRLCKWLLRIQDLAGDEFSLTQDFLSQMMGVRRSSVTAVALDLAHAGLIDYSRGHIRLLNIKGLRSRVCECHEQVKINYDLLIGGQRN